jgi:hypothetical protein
MHQPPQHPKTERTQTAEVLALGLTITVGLGRWLWEYLMTTTYLIGVTGSLARWLPVLADALIRPAWYLHIIFLYPLIYLPLLGLFRLSHNLTLKSGNLTRGSLAQGELDE